MRSKSQTLITGAYRTGSEYLTLLANCHPQISATMYRVNVLRFTYPRFRPIRLPQVQRQALLELESRLRDRYDTQIDVDGVLKELSQEEPVDFGVFYDAVMSRLYLESPIEHWAEKNQLEWRDIATFVDMMPNGKAILVLRDPRSVLASFKKHTYADPPAYLGAIFNCFDSMKTADELMEVLPSDRLLIARYEDVAREPREWAHRCWRFLKLDEPFPDPTSEGWTDAYGKPWYANSAFAENRRGAPFDVERAIARWRDELDGPEVTLTELVCGELMVRFGYECSQSQPAWPDALKLALYDDTIRGYFLKWLYFGEGIQEFPRDPTDPRNWSESRRTE